MIVKLKSSFFVCLYCELKKASCVMHNLKSKAQQLLSLDLLFAVH